MLDLDSYLERIGYSGPRSPTLETLRALQAQHPRAIPFENLDTLAGRPVRLDLASLERKLVQSRRGGYCFEQNLLFKHVLGALGFDVDLRWRRASSGNARDELRARTHMVLLVALGARALRLRRRFRRSHADGALRLAPDLEQATPHETFRVVSLPNEFAVEARVRGRVEAALSVRSAGATQVDIELLNHYVMSHADSPMLGRLLAARVAADRRFGLGNGVLSIASPARRHEQRRLGSVAEMRTVLASTFGIDVPAGKAVDAALERVLARRVTTLRPACAAGARSSAFGRLRSGCRRDSRRRRPSACTPREARDCCIAVE